MGLLESDAADSARGQRRNRGALEVVASILQICLVETKKSHIMYMAGITNDALGSYINLLVERRMLEKLGGYRTTEKGRRYLEYFGIITALLQDETRYDGETSRHVLIGHFI